jgi:hypothetical protein
MDNSSPLDQMNAELQALDQEKFDLMDSSLKPSQCYHFGTEPAHLLFNTNCPDSLRKKVKAIMAKYVSGYEDGE